jgi:hypothetical protein
MTFLQSNCILDLPDFSITFARPWLPLLVLRFLLGQLPFLPRRLIHVSMGQFCLHSRLFTVVGATSLWGQLPSLQRWWNYILMGTAPLSTTLVKLHLDGDSSPLYNELHLNGDSSSLYNVGGTTLEWGQLPYNIYCTRTGLALLVLTIGASTPR